MRRGPWHGAFFVAIACGPQAPERGEEAGGSSATAGSAATEVGGASETTVASSSNTSGASTGGDPSSGDAIDATGEPPSRCAVDETPVGIGVIEWEEIEPAAREVRGVAVTVQGVTVVGSSSDAADAGAVERFRLDGLPYWSRTWQPPGNAGAIGIGAFARPDGIVVTAFDTYGNGTSDGWLVAWDAQGEIAWEVPVAPEGSWAPGVSSTGTIVVAWGTDDSIALTEVGLDGAVLTTSEHQPAVIASVIDDLAVGGDGEIVALGRTSAFDGRIPPAWLGRFLPSYELDWWQVGFHGAQGVAIAEDGDLVLIASIFGARSTLVRLGPDGAEAWQTTVDFPHDVAVDCAGRIVIAAENEVFVLEADGTPAWSTPVDGGKTRVAVDPAGDLFIAGAIAQDEWLSITRVSGT